jgi:DNA ligase-1
MKIHKESPILQSKTRVGKDKFWQLFVLFEGSKWYTQTKSWQSTNDGSTSKPLISEPYECFPKNIGKKNETSAKEQSLSEFDSILKKQKDKGYLEAGEKSTILPLPMLAQKFKERYKKVVYPAYVQPKLNGMRMLYDGTKAWSRGGKLIIPDCIKHLQFDTKGYIFDGETMEATKEYKPGISEKLEYWIYDIISDEVFSKRYYEKLSNKMFTFPDGVIITPTVKIHSPEDVSAYHLEYVSKKFEGVMIRFDLGGYEVGHRSNQLLKLKSFVDDEFKIVDIIKGEGSYDGCAIFVCDNGHGKTFKCNPEGTMEIKQRYYKDRKYLLGKYLTIRYQELSKDEIPIFPVGISVRDTDEF